MRLRPAPCEKVMFSRASVNNRLTGTDSSMKLRRRSVSEPFWVAGGGAGGASGDGRDLDRPSTRWRKSPTGLRGRVTAKEDVNLPFIVSPIPPGRNDFRARLGLDTTSGKLYRRLRKSAGDFSSPRAFPSCVRQRDAQVDCVRCRRPA